MTKAIAHNINNILKHRERIFIIFVCGIIISGCLYGYLLQKAIVNVVQREKISKEISKESNIVSDFEARYFSEKNKINIELARVKGFKDAAVTSYISKKSLTAVALKNEL